MKKLRSVVNAWLASSLLFGAAACAVEPDGIGQDESELVASQTWTTFYSDATRTKVVGTLHRTCAPSFVMKGVETPYFDDVDAPCPGGRRGDELVAPPTASVGGGTDHDAYRVRTKFYSDATYTTVVGWSNLTCGGKLYRGGKVTRFSIESEGPCLGD